MNARRKETGARAVSARKAAPARQPVAPKSAPIRQPVAGKAAAVHQPVARKSAPIRQPAAGKAAAVHQPVAPKSSPIRQPVAGKAAAVHQPVARKSVPVRQPVTRNSASSSRRPVAKKPGSGAARPTEKESANIALGADCTIEHTPSLHTQLAKVLADRACVTLDVSAVKRCDTAGLQLLAAFLRERREAGLPVQLTGTSDNFMTTANVLGLAALFGTAGGGAAAGVA
jgi:ABC-type transporter Mla MlaB component